MNQAIRHLLIAGSMTLGIAVSASIAASVNSDSFAIADVTLGMDIDSVLKIYPEAMIEIKAPSCYRYGTPVRATGGAGRVLRHRDDTSVLALRFAAFGDGGELVRINYDRRVDPQKSDLRKLLVRLTTRYGPYDRILHRRKMEPAGRIIGFEWRNPNRASLRVVLYDDYRTSTDRYRLSFLARSGAVATPGNTCK